jgi:hypothetical protein
MGRFVPLTVNKCVLRRVERPTMLAAKLDLVGTATHDRSQSATTNLDAPTRNLQYIRDKHADQPAKDVPHLTASTCCLLNLRGCKQPTVKNVCIYRVFCVMLYSALCN